MNKLDEIEEIINTPGEPWADMHEDLRLLIRAVRQLYFACEEIKYAGGRWAGLVDPDVLELLEEK